MSIGSGSCGNSYYLGVGAYDIIDASDNLHLPLRIGDRQAVAIYHKILPTVRQKRLNDRHDVFMDRDDTFGGFCLRAL